MGEIKPVSLKLDSLKRTEELDFPLNGTIEGQSRCKSFCKLHYGYQIMIRLSFKINMQQEFLAVNASVSLKRTIQILLKEIVPYMDNTELQTKNLFTKKPYANDVSKTTSFSRN